MNFSLPIVPFDFRQFANPADELKSLWPSWVPYYQTKAGIAATLKPATILEVGVRYGYSGKAFLAGAPDAHYTGIDLDVHTNGGVGDNFAWARSILPPESTLIKADTQSMDRFPGDRYDLIHVDGQQTGESTYHDLELASAQGRYILCDGYFWTSENFNASNDFILHHKDIIESVIILPGYAGEMIIEIKDVHLAACSRLRNEASTGSQALAHLYTAEYFLTNCGGYDCFNENGGKILTDPRLATLADLLFARPFKRVLDVGCGRGEITIQSVLANASVTAVDYSSAAIDIARNAYDALPSPKKEVEWRHESAAAMQLSGRYDVAICGDVIEHMTPKEVDSLYNSIADKLEPQGWFIVHTFPNRWYYDYDYPYRQRQAVALGAHIPYQPRSRFERLMHINEQNPATMRKQLRAHFPHVLFWFASPDHPEGSLIKTMSPHEMAASRDIFAIASHEPIDCQAVLNALSSTPPLSLEEAQSITMTVDQAHDHMIAGAPCTINLRVTNGTPFKLNDRSRTPVRISYHWLNATTRETVQFEGQRTPIIGIYPGMSANLQVQVIPPNQRGKYLLQIRLIQEYHRWHEGDGFNTTRHDFLINVI